MAHLASHSSYVKRVQPQSPSHGIVKIKGPIASVWHRAGYAVGSQEAVGDRVPVGVISICVAVSPP